MLELCTGSVTPTWIDPMLEEFVVSRQEARPLLDISSPMTVAQDTIDPPLQTRPCVVTDEVALTADPTSARDGHRSPDPSTLMNDT